MAAYPIVKRILAAAALLALTGCVYQDYPGYYAPAYPAPVYAAPTYVVPPSVYIGGGWGGGIGWGGGGHWRR